LYSSFYNRDKNSMVIENLKDYLVIQTCNYCKNCNFAKDKSDWNYTETFNQIIDKEYRYMKSTFLVKNWLLIKWQ